MPNNNITITPTCVHRKIAVLGLRAVGKTSLTNAFVIGMYSDNYDPTIENTHHKTIRFRKVHFATDIIDTAGMDESLALNSSISRNASVGVHGYALVFSLTSRSSFESVIKINEALLNALGDAPDVPRVLVGSMKDLSDEREVMYQQAQSLADNWRIPYLECSSKTGENVAEVFHTLLKEIEKDDGLLNDKEEEKCIIL
jgi:Ras family protein